MHYQTPSKRQRVWSGAFWIVGFCLGITAFLCWRIVPYDWVLGLLSLWCFSLSAYLSGFVAAFVQVIHEDWFHDDDDDFHVAS